MPPIVSDGLQSQPPADPTSLTALTRSSLKEAFREVSRIQRVVGQRLELAAW